MNLYAERDIEAQGQVYCDHVSAMTGEGLHSKSDIAAELAHRDIRIGEIERENAELRELLAPILPIARRLSAQDNRATMDPMFCLQIKVRDIGYDANYMDDVLWIDMESGNHEEVEPEAEGSEKFGYRDRWETVMVAFTEEGLLDYMEQDGHNVKRRAYNGETRIYVESLRRCDEMVQIRAMLARMVAVFSGS